MPLAISIFENIEFTNIPRSKTIAALANGRIVEVGSYEDTTAKVVVID